MSDFLPQHGGDAVTLVMYHYVRPVPDRHGFAVKGLQPEEFDGQLDYIARYYNVCSLADVAAAAHGERPLPQRPCVLTFDDGLAEHAQEVWPRLRDRGWTGAFFASAAATLDRQFLDVHRIHLLLASGLEPRRLKEDLDALIRDHASAEVPTPEQLWQQFGVPGRFDGPVVNYTKRVLQRGLPNGTRREVLRTLFRRHVAEDDCTLAEEFYLSLEDLQAMAQDGMEIGGHGIDHEWMDSLSDEACAHEIHGTLAMVASVHGGTVPDRWYFAYPHGAYDQRTVDLLRGAGCTAAVTVEVDLAEPGRPMLELPRLDTNDLPFTGFSPPVPWTVRAGWAEPATETWAPQQADL